MSKAVLISIRPKYCVLIARGQKTIEVRKTRPKLEPPFKCYIYETRDPHYGGAGRPGCVIGSFCGGKVVGEFVCDAIYNIINVGYAFVVGKSVAKTNLVARASCLDFGDLHDYLGSKGGYGWHISDLKIYNHPKELGVFKRCHKCEYCEGCLEHEYSCDGTWALRYPPQSWCYVGGGNS